MTSRRCSSCGINWPPNTGAKCPVCLGSTDAMTAASPIDESEARRLATHAEFERYLDNETPVQRIRRRQKFAREQADRDQRFAAITSHL